MMWWLLYTFTVVVLLYALSNVPIVNNYLTEKHQQYLAKRLERHTKDPVLFSPVIRAKTADVFTTMEEVINKIGGPILDIGCGNGPNLCYYPSNTRLCTLDLNDFFKPYLLENLKKTEVKLETYGLGNAEDMSAVYKDNTFSCVVSSKLLCCVDQEKTLREIMRVLKPGGRMYFIEHIIEKPWTFTRIFQILMTPIWRRLVFNCQTDRDTDRVIKSFGFENLKLDIWNRPIPWKFFFARRTCLGYGDKPKN